MFVLNSWPLPYAGCVHKIGITSPFKYFSYSSYGLDCMHIDQSIHDSHVLQQDSCLKHLGDC